LTKFNKLIEKVLSGTSDSNIEFAELLRLLRHFGFKERLRGSHHIFFKSGIREIINIQPQGKMAKAYQVKQIRNIILNYKLRVNDENQI